MTTLPTTPECVRESFSVDLDQDELQKERVLRKKIREQLISALREMIRNAHKELGHDKLPEAIGILRDAVDVAVNREIMSLIKENDNKGKGL